MTNIIIKNNIRKIVKELDEEKIVDNVSKDVEKAIEEKTLGILKDGIRRAKMNQRKTLFARDL